MDSSQSYNVTQPNIEYLQYGNLTVITFIIILAIIMVVSLCGNVLVLVSLALNSGLRTHNNLLLANLAVADIITVSNLPISINTLNNGAWPYSHLVCILNASSVGLGISVGVGILMWISIHKFISITQPFSMKITSGKIVLMVILTWVWCIFFHLFPVWGWTDIIYRKGAIQCEPPTPIYFHFVILIVMTYCYCRIFQEIRIHMKRLLEFSDVDIQNSLVKQKQITVTLLVVLVCFILCWTPYTVYSAMVFFVEEKAVPEILNPIAYTFGYMNSACNPIIYALRLPSFRKSFKDIICCNVGKKEMVTSGTEGMEVDTNNKLKYNHQYTPQVLVVDTETYKRVCKYNKQILKKSISHDPTTLKQIQPPLVYVDTLYENGRGSYHSYKDPELFHRPRTLTNEFIIRKRKRIESW